MAKNQNRLEVNIPLAVALQITSIWQIWCAVHIVQHMEGSCGLSAKALSHVITLRFNKYSFTFNIMCNVHINMLHTQHHTGYRPVLVTGKPKQLLVVFLQLQNYWYSTNISSSSLAKSLPALSPSPVCATMSNRPSSFFTWLRLI